MDKDTIKAIMTTNDINKEDTDGVSNLRAFELANMTIGMEGEGANIRYRYEISLQELIDNGATLGDMEYLRKEGWEWLDKEKLVKYID